MIFLFIALAIIIAVFCYFFFVRICKTAGLAQKYKIVVRVVVAVCAIGVAVLSVFFLTVALFIVHVMVFALIVLLVDLIVKAAGKQRYKDGFKPWKIIYGSGIIPVVFAAAVIIGGYVNMNTVVCTEYSVYTQKRIRADGYKIALIADVHYGISVDGAELARICSEISAKNADVVVLCGDIVDENTSDAGMREVFSLLGGIDSTYGVYYVYGNHDRQLYANSPAFDEAELQSVVEECGIKVLRDAAIDLGELVLVGREDMSYKGESGRTPVAELLTDVDASKYTVVLDHQPRQYKENGEAGVDLLLSGHTHNGQIFPMNFIFDWTGVNDLMYGITGIGENGRAIVTSGVAGWGFNVKTASKAEYAIVNVLPEKK